MTEIQFVDVNVQFCGKEKEEKLFVQGHRQMDASGQ